ncbi:hypothetical protein RND71_028045 [Anisodus tanguticus]|uniref:Uncharacterized protein n=1 Tax=Anisodus tanguticus TaxID=243964 RepID=A0AAE1RKF0_9SOLA|nr:hypothetical protein RND71_028045 [Anisodus tanguticus]
MMELKAKYIASGTRIYRVLIPMENSLLNLGKEDLLIPEQCELLFTFQQLHATSSSLQALVAQYWEAWILTVTLLSLDWLPVVKLDELLFLDVNRLTYSVSPQDCGVGEGEPLYCARGCKIEAIGVEERPYPCHLTNLRSISCCVFALVLQYSLCPLPEIFPDRLVCLFQPSALREAAVAHSFSKTIDVYDQDIHLRTLRLNLFKGNNALQIVESVFSCLHAKFGLGGGNSVLAVAEGCQLSLWDLRMKEKGGCVRRICGSVGDILYAVCNSSKGTIAAGGADRTVTITGLAFSSVDPEYVYVQGVDYEVLFGLDDGEKARKYFRIEVILIGLDLARDVLGGWSDSCSIFVADIRGVDGVNELHLPNDLDSPMQQPLNELVFSASRN